MYEIKLSRLKLKSFIEIFTFCLQQEITSVANNNNNNNTNESILSDKTQKNSAVTLQTQPLSQPPTLSPLHPSHSAIPLPDTFSQVSTSVSTSNSILESVLNFDNT
jgi:hypothetical protein